MVLVGMGLKSGQPNPMTARFELAHPLIYQAMAAGDIAVGQSIG